MAILAQQTFSLRRIAKEPFSLEFFPETMAIPAISTGVADLTNAEFSVRVKKDGKEVFPNFDESLGGRNMVLKSNLQNAVINGATAYAHSGEDYTSGFKVTGGNNGRAGYVKFPGIIKGNGKYTFSFLMRGTQSTTIGCKINICGNISPEVKSGNNNQYGNVLSFTTTVENYEEGVNDFVQIEYLNYVYYRFDKVKLEKGDLTPWTPAPEEILSKATITPYNCSAAVVGDKVKITTLTPGKEVGWVDVTVTYGDGFTATQRFTWALAKNGTDGTSWDVNLLRNSTFNLGNKYWSSLINVLPPEPDKPTSAIGQVLPGSNNTPLVNSQRIFLQPKAGDKITFTFDVRFDMLAAPASASSVITFRRYDTASGGTEITVKTPTVTELGITGTGWQRVSYTYTFVEAHAVPAWFGFGLYRSTNLTDGGMLCREIEVRLGNKATSAWTPNPEDVKELIDNAATAANNAQTAANAAQNAVDDLDEYIDGAFKDGVIDAAEAKAIEKYINSVNEIMSKAEASYNKVYANTYLEGTAKTNLLNAKINLWGQRDTLLSAINTAISGGTTTPAQKTAVDNAFTTFNTLMLALQNALEEANKAIQAKLDANSRGYADGVQENVDSLKNFTDGAFANGLISRSERVSIEKYLNSVNETKLATDAEYIQTNNNSYLTGTAKTNLTNAKSALDTAYANLVYSINTAIIDDTATPAEKVDVDTKYGLFTTALVTYKVRYEEAQKAIQDKIKEESQNYTDSKIAPALQLSVSSQVMTFDSNNNPSPSQQTIEIEAKLQNVTGTVTFTATTYVGGLPWDYVVLGNTSNPNKKTLVQSQWGSNVDRIMITAAVGSVSDMVTIVKLKAGADGIDGIDGIDGTPGQDAITGFLTNENVTFPASTAGVVSNFSAGNGQFKVYEGLVDKTSQATFSNTASLNCTVSINSSGNYSVSAMTDDSATAVFRAVYKGVTIDRLLTLSKSRQGQAGQKGDDGLVDPETVAKINRSAAITDKFKTTIDGGLISTVMVELRESESATVTAGHTGIQGANKNLPAYWAGGTYAQAIAGTAKSIIRHDGSSKFTDSEFSGKITANTGSIGGFEIGSGRIGVIQSGDNPTNNGLSLYNEFIKFSNSNARVFLGTNVLPETSGSTALMRLENTGGSYSTKYGIQITVSGGSTGSNPAGNVALHIPGGSIMGVRFGTRRISGTTYLTVMDTNVIVTNNNTTIWLPDTPEDGQMYYLNANAYTGVTVRSYQNIYDNSGSIGTSNALGGRVWNLFIFDRINTRWLKSWMNA